MVERLVRSADFERVLRTPMRARSPHFAAHHVGGAPSLTAPAQRAARAAQIAESGPSAAKLSTTDLPASAPPVDDSTLPGRRWFGLVVPKRHARRAVTRSLLKRQIRGAMARRAEALDAGLWVIRLRAPFDPVQFPSARSAALQAAARTELDHLLASAAQPRGRAR